MRKLTTFRVVIALAVFALAVGFAGTAKGDPTVENLINEGAEDGVLFPWTSDDPAAGVVVADATNPALSGVRFFATDLTVITQGPVVIDQDVVVTGCGVEGLDGSWTADGFVFTDSSDTGQLVVSLDDASGASSAAKNSSGSYIAMGPITGSISDEAVTATVSMIGADAGTPDGTAFVHFDDMSFRITCVKDFAKISGKIRGSGGKGNEGRAGQYSFAGTVGHFDDLAMTLAGEYLINYQVLGHSCVFTPTSLMFADPSATVLASYVCDDVDTTFGNAVMRLTQGAGGPEGTGKNKDRGSVCVDADTDALDLVGVSGVCTAEVDELDLDKGNVKVSPPPA